VAKPITPEEMTAYVEATWNKYQEKTWQKQKPVGYAHVEDLNREHHDFWVNRQQGVNEVPLYAAPKREWVGLTDEESLDLVFDSKITEPNDEPIKFGAPSRQCIQNLISHVETKLREKNQ